MKNATPESVPDNNPPAVPSDLDFPVVGIGASAGGLPALIQLFENMPGVNGMAFVVVMHLSPKHASTIDKILQRATKMPVLQVSKATPVEKDHIYVISPNQHLSMSDGYLSVTTLERPIGQHVAIDVFFRALADVHKERAIAIVLSGTGADGAVGLARVKEQGGVTLAQHPEDAEHPGMPLAAIATETVDFILPVTEMPQKLLDLWNNAREIRLPPTLAGDDRIGTTIDVTTTEGAEESLQKVLALLRTNTGHDFRHYKRATVLRRIERRMQVRGVATLPAYCALLEKDIKEPAALLKDMLIGVTNFFRDREAFEALERDVIPELFAGKKSDDQLRVWVPACATGEEAYSIAMLLLDQAALISKPPDIQVFASDIDERAIAIARAGVYPASIVTDVPPTRLRQYFIAEENRYRINKTIRDKLLFAPHNLLRDPPFSKLDLISCRNLLIYLNREVQMHVLEMFHFALGSGGFLFLGSSESAEAVANFFTPIDKKNRIYRAKALSRSARYALPLTGAPSIRMPPPTLQHSADKRPFSFAEIHQRVLAEHAPPSVVVNEESSIVHMSDRAGRFLRHIGGEPSRNIVSLVMPELRLELRTALFQARQSGRSVEARRVPIERDGRNFSVNMVVRPFHDAAASSDFLLVLFDEVEQVMTDGKNTADAEGGTKDGNGKAHSVLNQLEQELQQTKEQLQQTIENAEVSTEELRASNEELQAINEELRSATEELETSKEELQSVNEELVTVNYELKVKVEETGKVNDDLNNLIASTDIATIFVDRAMRIKRYTPRASDIFSIIPSDIGRSLLDLTHRLDYAELARDATATFDTLRPVEREVSHFDGRQYIVRILPYRTTEDRIDGAVMTFFDITRRHQAEERLRLGEEHIRLVAESTKDYAIITLDTVGRITSWNLGAERIFGYREAEVMGQPADLIFVPEDREHGIPADEMRRAREDGRAEDERWHLRKDGTRFYCSGVMTPLQDGVFYGYAKIARDQTGRVQRDIHRDAALTHEQAGRANAEAASALKDEFLAIMSHELRHPLNMISLNLELLGRLPEVQQSAVGKKATALIRSSVVSQAKIIDDLLDLSRVSTGKLALAKADIDLSAVVNAAVDVARSDTAAAGLTIAVHGTQEPVMVNADQVRIEQMLLNLLDNAVKFSNMGGKVEVVLTREKSAEPNVEAEEVRLDVIDDGKGIEPAYLPMVFDMFGQASPVATRSEGGLGIGLAMVHQIAVLHGGRVEAASAGPGLGARFSIWLPLGNKASAAATPARTSLQNTIAGLRILLVDDMEDVATIFQSLLELEGAQTVHVAHNAHDGLALLKEYDIDLLISDIAMPDMDGIAFIKAVRSQSKNRHVPAIAISGLGRDKDINQALAAGFSSYISKPMSIVRLAEVVADVLPRTASKVAGT